MNYRDFLCIVLLIPACGPVGSDDGDSGSTSSTTGSTTGSTGAPIPTTGDDSTTGADPTTGADSTTGDDPTTGAPPTCPEDQAPWSTVVSAALALPADVGYFPFGRSPIALPDGNIALAVSRDAPGVAFLSPLGEVLSVNAGAAQPMTFVATGAADPNGGVIVVGHHGQSEPHGYMARFAADGAALGEVPVAMNQRVTTMAIAGDAVVVLGREDGSTRVWLGRYDIVTGAQQWEVQVSEEPDLILSRLLVDAQGDIFVAGASDEIDAGSTELRMFRFAGDGQPLWSTAFAVPPYDLVTDLDVAPGGQIVALRIGPFPEYSVDLIAVEPADGALAWEANLAVPDASGRPSATDLHVDADALTIPIVRSEPGGFERRAVDVQRVSFTGELLERVPLMDIPASEGGFNVMASARGTCGELTIVFESEGELWFAAYAR